MPIPFAERWQLVLLGDPVLVTSGYGCGSISGGMKSIACQYLSSTAHVNACTVDLPCTALLNVRAVDLSFNVHVDVLAVDPIACQDCLVIALPVFDFKKCFHSHATEERARQKSKAILWPQAFVWTRAVRRPTPVETLSWPIGSIESCCGDSLAVMQAA